MYIYIHIYIYIYIYIHVWGEHYCESMSASERQDEEHMPRETGTRQGRTPPTGVNQRGGVNPRSFAGSSGLTQRGGPRRGPTTGGEGHTGDPHRAHTDRTHQNLNPEGHLPRRVASTRPGALR